MNLVVKQEELRTIMFGQKNGFEINFEFVKVNNTPVEVVYFNGFKENATLSGSYHSVGNQLSVSAGGHEGSFSDIIDEIVVQCIQLCLESNLEVVE